MAVRKTAAGARLKRWFKEKWVDVKTGKPCGRKSAKGGGKRPYPACRPTKSMCTSAKKKKKGPARISWKKGAKK